MDAKSNTMFMVGGEFREQFREYEDAFQELCMLLEIDEEDLEEQKEEIYDEVKKSSKFFASLDSLPNISPDDDGADRKYVDFRPHADDRRMGIV